MSNIVLYIPVNKTGYGYHATMMTKDAVLSGDVHLVPYWENGIDVHEELPQGYASLVEEGNRKRQELAKMPYAFIFCHLHLLTAPNRHKIGYSTFEIDQLPQRDVDVVKQLNAVGTATDWGQRVLSQYHPDTFCIPGGVNIEMYKPTEDKFDDLTLVSVGKFERRKGHMHVLEALKNWDGPDIVFHAYWFNFFVPMQEIIGMIRRRGWKIQKQLPGSCTFTSGKCRMVLHGWSNTREEMVETITRSHLGIYPSAAEGWNLPLVEAMSCGLPCVTTQETAHSHYISEKNAIIVDVQPQPAYDGRFFPDASTSLIWNLPDPRDMRQKIKDALESYPTEISVNARQTAENYDWSRIGQQFIQYIRSNPWLEEQK